jgi:zeta-carotene isomerase
VWPFAAILDGRQVLPPDVWKEFARAPYALIAVGTVGAYLAHPWMQAGAALVRNVGLVEGGVLDPLFA